MAKGPFVKKVVRTETGGSRRGSRHPLTASTGDEPAVKSTSERSAREAYAQRAIVQPFMPNPACLYQ